MENQTSEQIQKSYVEQCLSIKNELFAMLRKSHDELKVNNDKYLNDAFQLAEKLGPLIDDGNKLLNNFRSECKIIQKMLDEKIDSTKKILKEELDRLREQYSLGTICIDTMTKRMDDLESYIRNERFHDIVKEINDLEDRFETEAIKLVQKRMKERK